MKTTTNEKQLVLKDSNIPKLFLFAGGQFLLGVLLIASSLLHPLLVLCGALPGILLALTSPLWFLTLQQIEARFDKAAGTVTILRRSRFVLSQPEQYPLRQIYEVIVDRQSPVPFWWQMWQQRRNPEQEQKLSSGPSWNDRHHLVLVLHDRLQVPLSTAKLRRGGCASTAVALKSFLA